MAEELLGTVYEPMIRRAAGLGSAAKEADPDKYEKSYAHCDVLVIGSGPTGLMAALTAARSGARVILADEGSRLGGSLLYEHEEIDGKSGLDWANEYCRIRRPAEVQAHAAYDNIRLVRRQHFRRG